MSKHGESRYELHHELEKGLGQRGAVLLMEELQGLRVNVPSIMAAVGLSFAATRLR